MKNHLSKRAKIEILSAVFVITFSISIASVYYYYLSWNYKKLDAVNAVAYRYEQRNLILNAYMFLGYSQSRYPNAMNLYYAHEPNFGYISSDVMDEYVLQYYLNRYEFLEGKEVSLSSVEIYYSPRENSSELISLEEVDTDTKAFIEYMTDNNKNTTQMFQGLDIWFDKYYILLDAKCQEMYGVGLFDVEAEGEGDSAQIGNYDLWDYVLTMDQMNAAAQSLLLEKDAVS
mgnify:CR=1 FL=1